MNNHTHYHDYDDEPPIQTDANGNLYAYGCKACNAETGDPYAWVAKERATDLERARKAGFDVSNWNMPT